MSAEQWRWTDDEGVQRLLLGDDLRTALRQGRLKPTTLVWRRGMKNWVPASEVPELAAELGAAATKPVTGGEIGRVAPPTASIPPPIGDARARAASGRPMPSNMVDIGALRSRTGSEPARPDPDAKGAEGAGAVAIPRAPRVPATPTAGSAPTGGPPVVRSHKPRTTSVDGLWSKPDVESTSTTTMVRDDKGGVSVAGPRPRGAAEGARAAPTWPRGRAIDNPPTADTETQPNAADRGAPPGRAGAGSLSAPKATAPMPLSRSVTRAPPPPSHAPPARPPAAPAPTTEGGAKRTVPPPPPVRKVATATPVAKATPAASPKKVVDFARTLAGGIRPVPGAQPRRPTEPLLEWGALIDGVVGPKPADDARPERTGEGKPTPDPNPAAATPAAPAPDAASPAAPAAPADRAHVDAGPARGPSDTGLRAPDAATGPVFAGAAATASAPWLAAKAARDLGDEPSFTAPLPFAFTPTPSDVGAMLGAQASTPAPTHGAAPAAPAAPAASGGGPPASDGAPPAAATVASAAAGAPKTAPPASRAPAAGTPGAPTSSVPVSGRVGRAADLGRGDAGVPEPTPSRAALSLRSIRLPKWAPAAAGAAALVLGTTAFALGRCSAPDETPVAYAHSGLSSLLLMARGAPAAAAPAAARPCLMIRAPARWAPSAITRVPTEIAASSSGLFAVGFARGDKQAGGLTVSPATGVVEDVFKPAASEDAVARVVPYEDGGKLVFGVSLAKQGGLANGVQVAASPPLLLGFTEAAVASVPVIEGEPHGDPVSLWLLDRSSGTPNALRAAVAPARGIAVAYRTGARKDPPPWQIWYGWVGADGTVGLEAKPVGSALNVGMPVVAHNGIDVSLVYADKQEEKGPSRVLWAHGPLGQPLGQPQPFTPPPGGPGGDAIAPSIVGLGDGRWALLWTEGSEGARVLRAQTFDRDYQPLGDALRVSPATGNFGQGSVGVVNEDAVVAFLLKSGDAYELWGTMLQCR